MKSLRRHGKKINRVLVTGGAGFIGANFIRHLHRTFPDLEIVNYDKLTYAGNPENLNGIGDRYRFIKGDICDQTVMHPSLADGVEVVVNFAAETHVDRSIHDPGEFIMTDVYGVFVILEGIRRSANVRLFVHVSTDEVYGSIAEGAFRENSPLNPSSPYAASKAGGDRLAYSYHKTYGMPLIIVRPANNYGPFQYPEKLIPFFVTSALQDKPLPVYGNGTNRRDWLFVEDTARGIVTLIQAGAEGEVYNMGGGQELTNIDVTRRILECLNKPESLIRYVPDRLGHDFRYALDWEKLSCLGWRPQVDFSAGLARTVRWYQQNAGWWQRLIKKREFQEHLKKNY